METMLKGGIEKLDNGCSYFSQPAYIKDKIWYRTYASRDIQRNKPWLLYGIRWE